MIEKDDYQTLNCGAKY